MTHICDYLGRCKNEGMKCDECLRNVWTKMGKFYEDWYEEL